MKLRPGGAVGPGTLVDRMVELEDMMKGFVQFSALGVAGLLAWKLLFLLVAPMLGAMFMVMKIALLVLVGYVIYTAVCKMRATTDDDDED